jgi:hypothetical protein
MPDMRLPRRGLRELVDTVASAMGFAPRCGDRGRKRRTSRRLRLEMLEGRNLLAAGSLLQSWHCGPSALHAQLVSASSATLASVLVQQHQSHFSSGGGVLSGAGSPGPAQGSSRFVMRAANWQPAAPADSLSSPGQIVTPQYFQNYQGGTMTLEDGGSMLIGAGTIDTHPGTWSPGSGMLSGANTYSGNIPVNAGTLQLAGGTTTLGTTTPGTITPGATTLNIGAAGTLVPTIGGVLRFSVATGTGSPVTIGAGVTAMVPSGGTLELAGSVSDLSSPSSAASRVNIVNNSSQTGSGLLVSGTSQQVGAIDGSGTTTFNAGSDLTADHIVQSALVIGGTAATSGLVTISAADSSGSPLTASGGLRLAGALAPSAPFGAGALSGSSLLALGASSSGAV